MDRLAPANFLRLRREVLQTVAELLQKQVYARETTDALLSALQRQQERLVEELAYLSEERFDPALRFLGNRLQIQRTALSQLHELIARFAQQHSAAIGALLARFQEQSRKLARTVVESDLLEEQQRMMEKMVLSVDRVLSWNGVLEEVLHDVFALVQFDLFFVLFEEEENRKALYLYPTVSLDPSARALVEKRILEPNDALPPSQTLSVEVEIRRVAEVEISPASIDWSRVTMVSLPITAGEGKARGVVGFLMKERRYEGEGAAVFERLLLAMLAAFIGSSRSLARAFEEVEFYALHDAMTGLRNRRQFLQALELECERSERFERPFSVVLLNLDDFMDVNNAYGSTAGDMVLREVAALLQQVARPDDLLFRVGGDEFAVLLPNTPLRAAISLTQRLTTTLRERLFQARGQTFQVTASAGVAAYPTDAAAPEQLLHAVESALNAAKRRGKDEVCSASELISEEARAAMLRSEAEHLREALRERRIVPYFQPIFDLRTSEVLGYEVLARLIERNGEVVPAGRFIAAIEKYGLSRELDRQILAAALRIAKEREKGAPLLFLNLSIPEIQNRNVLAFARSLCSSLGIDPQRIVFELLERHAVTDMTAMRRFIGELREEGFRFALDDFGSGFNSLAYLREFTIDFVKIDGSYVREVVSSRVDAAMVRHLTNLCSELGIATIAEFVEDRTILTTVRAMGVGYGQGYFLGRPASDFLPGGVRCAT